MLIFNRSRELNRVNNIRALLEVSSPIKVLSTPHSGLGKFIVWTGYSSALTSFTRNIQFTTVLRPCLLCLSDHRYQSGCLVLADYMKRE